MMSLHKYWESRCSSTGHISRKLASLQCQMETSSKNQCWAHNGNNNVLNVSKGQLFLISHDFLHLLDSTHVLIISVQSKC